MGFLDLTDEEIYDIAYNMHLREPNAKQRKRAGSRKGGKKTSATNRTFLGKLDPKDFALVVMKKDKI